jgi:hypothetical protein
MLAGMTDETAPAFEAHTAQIQRNGAGQFVTGHTGIGGRKLGSRNKLAEDLIRDIHTVWVERGIDALRQTAELDPAKFCALAVQVLPKDVKVDHDITVTRALDAVEAYRTLRSLPREELEQLENASLDTVG